MSVCIVCPNKHRVSVKVTPQMTLYQILQEACQRKGYSADDYGLQFRSKQLDLSLTFRFSALPINCTLEMTPLQAENDRQKCADVTVALQLMNGERATASFAPSTSLMDVLLHFEKLRGEPLATGLPADNVHPVLVYLSTEYVGGLTLSNTSLKSLGIKDRALFRHLVRPLDREKIDKINKRVEAEADRQAKFVRQEFVPPSSHASAETVATTVQPAAPCPEPMEASNAVQPNTPAAEEHPVLAEYMESNCLPHARFQATEPSLQGPKQVNESCPVDSTPDASLPLRDRKLVVFHKDDDVAKEPDDHFFEMTKSDAVLAQKRLQEQAARLMTPPLVSQAYLHRVEESCKADCWINTVIRIRLPRGWILQATFRSQECLKTLYAFVEECVVDSKKPLELWLPPTTVLRPCEETLLEANLAPQALLILRASISCDENIDVILKPAFLQYVADAEKARLYAVESLSENKEYKALSNGI